MSRIALIPARGGSKRVPDKNIRDFAGRPIIHHAIRAAITSGLFERVLVSTDSERVATVARAGGAEVPFLRNADTADDHAPLAAAVIEVVERLDREGSSPDHICCLLATAPLVRPEFLEASWRQLAETGLDAVASIQRFHYPIQRALRLNEGGLIEMMWPDFRTSRSQDLEPAWHDAGQFYWVTREALLRDGRLIAGRAGGYPLGPLDAVDIDTPQDWAMAEQLYAFHRHQEGRE